jgi:hypothetical protein
LAVAGCSEDGQQQDDGAGGTASADCGGEGETFSAGMSKPGANGTLGFVLVSSDPAPPQIVDSVWTIEVTEAGAPVEGASLIASAKMPRHGGHLAAVQPDVTEVGGGRYTLDPVALEMPGLWEVTLQVTTASDTTDTAAFEFCIAG